MCLCVQNAAWIYTFVHAISNLSCKELIIRAPKLLLIYVMLHTLMLTSMWEQYKLLLPFTDWGADLATFFHNGSVSLTLKHTWNINVCVSVSFIDFSSPHWPFLLLDLNDPSLSDYASTHLLCMSVLHFSPDTLPINHLLVTCTHRHACMHTHTHTILTRVPWRRPWSKDCY